MLESSSYLAMHFVKLLHSLPRPPITCIFRRIKGRRSLRKAAPNSLAAAFKAFSSEAKVKEARKAFLESAADGKK
jgi:hypothetical protein